MKIFILMLSVVGISLSSIFVANADEPEKPKYFLGGYAALNSNIHQADFQSLPECPSCSPGFRTGNGFGFAAGVLFNYPLVDNISLDFRLGYSGLHGELNATETIGNVELLNSGVPATVDAVAEHIIDASLSTIGLDATVNFKFFSALESAIGIRGAFLMSASTSQTETLISPDFVTFLDGKTVRNEYKDIEIADKNSFQMFGVAGLSYDFPISKTAYISPELRFYFPITDISSADWSVSTLHIGVALKIPVFAAKPLPAVRDTLYLRDTTTVAKFGLPAPITTMIGSKETFGVIEGNGLRKLRTTISEYYRTQIPEYAELSSSISAVGITKDGKRIVDPVIIIEEIETREDFPLLPYVFFQNGSSDLTKTVMKLRSKADYNELDLKDLPWNTLGIYSDLLNIVALRMNAYPQSSITITGCNNNTGIESKNIALSGARAAAVKKYLREICGIDAVRIKTKSRNLPAQPGRDNDEDGMAENSRVEISSNTANILSPMSLSENQRTADPPTIEIIPSVKAEKDLKNWDIKVNQDDKIIREYSGEGMPKTQIWQVEEGLIPEMEKPLGIVMNVEDEYGQTKRAETALNIKQLTIKKKRNILKN
ncbi:MAG: OmpA family protein, partial [Candidatus Kapabacteria bacterium]|nr:OmpA family protein [Candidatus Kapabacteria bacterium]